VTDHAIVHLTGSIKTHPVLGHITSPDGAPTPRLINTLIGAGGERHTIIFTGPQARAAHHALATEATVQLTGRLVSSHRVEVHSFTVTAAPLNQTPNQPIPARDRDRYHIEAGAAARRERSSRSATNVDTAGEPHSAAATMRYHDRPRQPQLHRRRNDRKGSLRL
jgi:hypothetical protein